MGLHEDVAALRSRVNAIEPLSPELVGCLLVDVATTGVMIEICLRHGPTIESGEAAVGFAKASVSAARLLGLYTE